jgi:hypothetical protein
MESYKTKSLFKETRSGNFGGWDRVVWPVHWFSKLAQMLSYRCCVPDGTEESHLEVYQCCVPGGTDFKQFFSPGLFNALLLK